ncbi:hypothetical protein MAP00_008428 [Monascus purpureus]|nr:hypothetical protein MAP00_008428 [Monascus purpureus]
MATSAPARILEAREPTYGEIRAPFKKTKSPDGFYHLGDDSNGVVIQYAQLSPQQIQQALSEDAAFYTPEQNEHLANVFKDVDGRNVQGSALLYPGPDICPPVLFANSSSSAAAAEGGVSPLELQPRHERPARPGNKNSECSRYPDCEVCDKKGKIVEDGICK